MKFDRKINFSVFPKFCQDYFNFKLYVEGLSEFTIYGEAQRLKSFFKYMLATKIYKDISKYPDIKEFTSVSLGLLKKVKYCEMYSYIEYLSTALNYAPQTKSHTVAVVKKFYLSLCKDLHVLRKVYFADLKIPKYRLKPVVNLTSKESFAFLDIVDNNASPRDKAIIYLIMNTGARRCEVRNSLLCNLDLDNRTLLVCGKGEKYRYLFLNDLAMKALKEYLDIRQALDTPSAFLFLTKNQNPLSYNDVYRIVQKYLIKAKLDIHKYSTHKLRHTFATLLYQNGTDIRAIADLLGHANIDTTMRYAHTDLPLLHNIVDNYVLNKA